MCEAPGCKYYLGCKSRRRKSGAGRNPGWWAAWEEESGHQGEWRKRGALQNPNLEGACGGGKWPRRPSWRKQGEGGVRNGETVVSKRYQEPTERSPRWEVCPQPSGERLAFFPGDTGTSRHREGVWAVGCASFGVTPLPMYSQASRESGGFAKSGRTHRPGEP